MNGSATAQQPQRCVIVIPCYEEANRLRRDQFSGFLASGFKIQFLFVNDGSKDGTLALLRDMEREHPGCMAVLNKTVNGGKGEAIRDGMLAAMGPEGDLCDFVGFWDADLATPLSAIPGFLEALESNPGLDMVFGARIRLLGRSIHRKATRHYAGRLFATVVSLILKIPIYDTQCGAKLFRVTPDLRGVLQKPFASKWIFDVEMLARFIERRGQMYCIGGIYEMPLQKWRDVGGSKLKSFDFIRAFADLITIYRNHLAKSRSERAAPRT